jgi:hypothetical protein
MIGILEQMIEQEMKAKADADWEQMLVRMSTNMKMMQEKAMPIEKPTEKI